MENINTFSKGLHRSNSPISQPESSYPDALNWIRNDEGRLSTEQLEEITGQPINAIYRGGTNLNGEYIIFFTLEDGQSQIGTFTKESGYTAYYTGNLNFQTSIDATARIIFNNQRVVYFVEDNNPPRFFNLDKPVPTDVEDFKLFLNFQLPEISNISVNTTGSLKTGIYYLIARYKTSSGNITFTGLPSNPIPIVDGIRGNNNDDNYDGADPGSISNKSISFTVTNNDTNYPFIEILVVTYEEITNVLTAYTLGTFKNDSSTIIFSSNEQYVDRVSLEELTIQPTFYTSASCIEQKDNVLTLSNLKTQVRNEDIQRIANNVDVVVVPSSNTYNEITNGLPSSIDEDVTLANSVTVSGNNFFPNSPKDELYIKDFQRDETYSFSLIPIYKDGSIGFAYPIPAKAKTLHVSGYYTTDISTTSSDIMYPDNYADIGNTPVRNHLIPNNDEWPLFQNNIVTTLKLKFYVDLSIIPDIQGYIIGYQKRNTSLNSSILTEGIMRPFLKNSGFAAKWPAPLNGAFLWRNSSLEIVSSQTSLKDFQFLSPDIIHGKEYSGNQMEFVGIQKITSRTIAAEGWDSGDQFVEFMTHSPTEGYTHKSIKGNIIESIEIPTSEYGKVPQTYSANGETFLLRGTKGYQHISTDAALLSTVDFLATDGKRQFTLYDGDDEWYSYSTNGRGLTSAFDAYIARIRNNTTTQYGRVDNAEYSILGYSLNNSPSVTVGGDVYTQKYAFDVAEGLHEDSHYLNPTSEVGYLVVRGIIYVFLQSQNNYAYKHYNQGELPYYPKYKILYNPTEPLGLGNIDITKGYSTGYNRQYSAVNDIKTFVSKPQIFEEVTNFPNKTIYSELALEGELSDSMRIFPPNNFHDIPKNKGAIIDTFIFNNDFYHHTERGLWKSFFNPNTTQATSQGDVVLGTLGIFRLPSIEILTLNGGYAGTTTKQGINTPFGRVLIDNHQSKVFLLSDGLNEISDNGMFSYFRDFINYNDSYTTVYDFNNKRVLINNISKQEAISYYPKTNTWTSRHDFSPDIYFTIDQNTYAFKNTNFYTLQGNSYKDSNITLVINNEPDIYKRFERAELNTTIGPNVLKDSQLFNKETFTHLQCWNETQNSTNLPIEYSDDFSFYMDYSNDKVFVQYFKGDYKIELPLDTVIDVNQDIFASNNNDINKLFKEPFTSKFLYLKLSYNKRNPLVLSYVKTFSKESSY